MRTCIASIEGLSPYSPSRAHETPALDKETKDAYEDRTWREKGHYAADGRLYIPPMAFKQSLDIAAKMLGRQIPGKGKATYTKFFLSGVLCMDPVMLQATRETVACERIHANADGVRGSGKRVWRKFPRVDEWSSVVTFHVVAAELTKDVFEEALEQSGAFVGIGRFRPQNGGFFGRFAVTGTKWS
jgi:hypothetical protein